MDKSDIWGVFGIVWTAVVGAWPWIVPAVAEWRAKRHKRKADQDRAKAKHRKRGRHRK